MLIINLLLSYISHDVPLHDDSSDEIRGDTENVCRPWLDFNNQLKLCKNIVDQSFRKVLMKKKQNKTYFAIIF